MKTIHITKNAIQHHEELFANHESKPTLTAIAWALLLSSLANAADTYKIDPAHTSIGFSVRHGPDGE
jgi:polyisoprenoid-binding protein YceI